ncbi:hypothetical protein PMAYCL1PPCAC_03803, partial [Pristionchus mayeri]
MLRAHLDELELTINTIFNRMIKTCKRGMLRNSVSAVSLILKEIATGPDIPASVALKEKVPYELLDLLALIDPLSVPFELLCAFISNKEKRLEMLCKWKKYKGPELMDDDEE